MFLNPSHLVAPLNHTTNFLGRTQTLSGGDGAWQVKQGNSNTGTRKECGSSLPTTVAVDTGMYTASWTILDGRCIHISGDAPLKSLAGPSLRGGGGLHWDGSRHKSALVGKRAWLVRGSAVRNTTRGDRGLGMESSLHSVVGAASDHFGH